MDRVELIVQLTGDTRAMASLRDMQRLVNDLNTKKVHLKMDAADVDRRLADARLRLSELTARKHEIKIAGGDIKQVNREIEDLQAEIAQLVNQKKHISIDTRLNTEAMSQANAELREMERNSISVSDALRGIGSAFSTVGGLFSEWSSMVGGDILNTITRTLTGYGTILATQGLSTATSRFDTFRTFPRVMEVMGYSIDQTDAAVRRLESSVLGLPTSLNDIIDIARDFILLTNDLDRGVDLATSINNLFVAGGADAEEVRIGLKQFRDLLSKGSLMDREWDSLARTLGVSLRFIASEAGYAEDSFGDFRTALKGGEIGVDEFLDAVVRAGSSGRVKDVLEEMKDTLNATTTNLRTAFANLGATVLTEMDALFKERTGEGLPGTILTFSNAIKQRLIPAVREWLQMNGDRLFDLFERIRGFDWGGLLRAIADKSLKLAETIMQFVETIGSDRIIWFISNGLTWAGMLGRLFSLLGRLFTTAGGAVSMIGGFTLISKGIGGLFSGIGSWKTMLTGIGGAAGAVLIVAGVGAVLYEYAKLAQHIGTLDFGNLDANLPKVLKLAGIGAGVSAALTVILGTLGSIGQNKGALVALTGMGLSAAFGGLVLEYGYILRELSQLSQVIGDLNLSDFDTNYEKLDGLVAAVTKYVGTLVTINAVLVGIGTGIGAYFGGPAGAAIGAAVVGGTIAASEILTSTFIATLRNAISGLRDMAALMDEVSGADVPTDAEIERFKDVVKALAKILRELPSIGFKESDVTTLVEFVNALNALGSIKVEDIDMSSLETMLTDTASTLGRISTTLSAYFGDDNAVVESKSQANVTENMVRVVENLGNAATEMYKIRDALLDLDIAVDAAGRVDADSSFGQLKTRLEAVMNSLMELYNLSGAQFGAWGIGARWSSGNLIHTVDNLAMVIQELEEAAKRLDEAEPMFTSFDPDRLYTLKDRIKSLIASLKEISDTLQDPSDWFAFVGKWRSKSHVGTAQNFVALTEQIKSLATFFLDLEEVELTRASVLADVAKPRFESIINALKGIGDLFGKGTIGSWWEGLELKNQEGSFNRILGFASMIRDFVANVQEAMEVSAQADISSLEAFKGNVTATLSTMQEIIDAIADPEYGPGGKPTGVEDLTHKIETIKKYAEGMGHLIEAIKTIRSFMPYIQAIRESGVDEQLQTIVSNTVKAVQELPDDIEDKAEKIQQLKTIAEELKTVFETIASMQESLKLVGENDTITLLLEQLTQLINSLGTIEVGEEGGANISTLAASIEEIGTVIDTLINDHVNVLIEKIGAINGDIVDLTDNALANLIQKNDDLTESMTKANDMANKLRGAIIRLKDSMEQAAPAVDALTGQMSAFQGAVDSAIGAVEGLVSAIGTLNSTPVNLPSGLGGSIQFHGGRSGPQEYAKGGPVYLARGGTFWIPRGTDTVPAMLTPGEFVLRRPAVQKLGVPFLNMLNRLDIPRAIDALMSRVVLPSAMSSVVYDNRRTYDNHATVNQNIYTNNPDYAYRRASRWAHAL